MGFIHWWLEYVQRCVGFDEVRIWSFLSINQLYIGLTLWRLNKWLMFCRCTIWMQVLDRTLKYFALNFTEVCCSLQWHDMTVMVSQITSNSTVYSTISSGVLQRDHQRLAYSEGNPPMTVESPHIGQLCFHVIISSCHVNSSPPGAPYMHQWTGSALVRVMACHLFRTKP